MPKSKRSQLVTLTKTKTNRKEMKRGLVVHIQEALDKQAYAYVVGFENMRTGHFKELRQEWSDSRFFLGKNKVMQIALGGDGDDAYRPGLDGVAADLVGNVGLLFTSREPAQVEQFFTDYSAEDYARSGFEATEGFSIPAGRLEEMPHTMCETLRKLGVPVRLDKGTVVVTQEHLVCEEGKMVTPEQGRLLKLFGRQMAVFRVRLLSRWTAKTGEYEQLEAKQEFDASKFAMHHHAGNKAVKRTAKGGAGKVSAGAGAGADADDDENEDEDEELD